MTAMTGQRHRNVQDCEGCFLQGAGESLVIFLWRLKWFCDKQYYSVKGDGFGAASHSASVWWKGRELDPLEDPNGKMSVLNMKL